MIRAASSIELETFEQVLAGPGMALLRITARLRGRSSSATPSPTLLIDDRGRIHRLAALPGPPDPSGMLRGAYSAPTELLERRPAFTLELSDGEVVKLPAPTLRRTRSTGGQAQPTATEPLPISPEGAEDRPVVANRALAEERDRLSAEVEHVRDSIALVEEEARKHKLALALAEEQVLSSEARAIEEADARREAEERLVPALEAVQAADARAANAELQVAELQQSTGDLERQLENLRAALAGTEAGAQDAVRQLDEEAAARQATQARVEELEAERDQLAARTEDLQVRLADAHSASNRARQLEQQLVVARDEMDRLRSQIEQSTGEPRVQPVRLQARFAELKRERASELHFVREETERLSEEAERERAAALAELESVREASERSRLEAEAQASAARESEARMREALELAQVEAMEALREAAEARALAHPDPPTEDEAVAPTPAEDELPTVERADPAEDELPTVERADMEEDPTLEARPIAEEQEEKGRGTRERPETESEGAHAVDRQRTRKKTARETRRNRQKRPPSPPSSPERGPGGASLLQTRASRYPALPAERKAQRRSESAWLPSETVLGICLLVFGITLAVLILSGVVKLGFVS